MNIDPLAEDYSYQSPYNFAENRVVDSAELEGLERIYAADGKFINQVGESQKIRIMSHNDGNAKALVNTANNTKLSPEERSQAVSVLNNNSYYGFESVDDAAGGHAEAYNQSSIDSNAEIGAAINEVSLTNADGESIGSTFILGDGVSSGDRSSIDAGKMIYGGNVVKNGFSGKSISLKMPGELVGLVHTHGRGSLDFSTGGDGVLFSSDQTVSKKYNVPTYMSNKKGQLRKANFHLGEKTSKVLRSNIPANLWKFY